jgi:hypothetical protein
LLTVGAGLSTLFGTGSETAVVPAAGDDVVSGLGFLVWAAVPGSVAVIPGAGAVLLSAEFCHLVGEVVDTL